MQSSLLLWPEVKAGELVFLTDDEAAVGECGRGAAHAFDFGSGDLFIGSGRSSDHGKMAAVVFEHHELSISQQRRGDGAIGILLPFHFTAGEVDALVLATTHEINATLVHDGRAAVAHGDPEM